MIRKEFETIGTASFAKSAWFLHQAGLVSQTTVKQISLVLKHENESVKRGEARRRAGKHHLISMQIGVECNSTIRRTITQQQRQHRGRANTPSLFITATQRRREERGEENIALSASRPPPTLPSSHRSKRLSHSTLIAEMGPRLKD